MSTLAYFDEIKQPWLKISTPVVAAVDCLYRNIEDNAAFGIDSIYWTVTTLWILAGSIYLLTLAVKAKIAKRKNEARIYLYFLIAIVLFLTLTPQPDNLLY